MIYINDIKFIECEIFILSQHNSFNLSKWAFDLLGFKIFSVKYLSSSKFPKVFNDINGLRIEINFSKTEKSPKYFFILNISSSSSPLSQLLKFLSLSVFSKFEIIWISESKILLKI